MTKRKYGSKMFDKILRIVLLLFFFLIFFNVFIADVLHVQTCEQIVLNANLSCEEEVAEQARNCKYRILFWEKVEPSKRDIEACLESRVQQKSENSTIKTDERKL